MKKILQAVNEAIAELEKETSTPVVDAKIQTLKWVKVLIQKELS